MSGARSTQIRKEKCIKDLVGKLSKNCPPENLCLYNKINIKIMFTNLGFAVIANYFGGDQVKNV